MLQKLLQYGINVVIRSCLKYISGHSDIVGKIAVVKYPVIQIFRNFSVTYLGPVMSPTNAWLAISGLKILPVRMKYLDQSVKEIIGFLQNDERIEKIYHPFYGACLHRHLAAG